MENLPDHLIIEILTRLDDSTELARCRCVSKTLNTLAPKVPSIHLYCSFHRYAKMRLPESKVTPLKTIFHKLISDAKVPIESVSLGVEEAVNRFDDYDYRFEENCDDLFLTGGCFSDGWMTKIGHALKSISISSFWVQPEHTGTNILEVLSYNCHSLVELKLEEAHLLVNDMHMMPLLASLTLNYVTMCDESLNKLIESLPCLQFLHLISCFSRENDRPKIHHLNLTDLKWTISHSHWDDSFSPLSHTIFAPNLTTLELETDYPSTLSIHAPLLSYCNLALESTKKFNVDRFKSLKTLCLASLQLYNILLTFPSSTTVQNLTLLPTEREPLDDGIRIIKFSLLNVFSIFPNVTSLAFGSEVWSKQMEYPSVSLAQMKGLKQITVYLESGNIDKVLSFILYVMGLCTNLSDIVLFFHSDVDLSVAISFVSSWMSWCPKVRWQWGTWKRTDDLCISNTLVGAANTI